MRLRNLFRPFYVIGRIRHEIYERQHPDHPWLAPGSIAWLDAHLTKDMQGFEWGSGRSTCWLAQRIASLISIEHEPNWYGQVKNMVQEKGLTHVDLRHVLLEHPCAGTYENAYDPLPRYVAEILPLPDSSLDFVLVDGWYRPVCAQSALSKLKPGGLLCIDNTDWQHPPHYHVPKDWPLVHESRNVLTRTSIWKKPPLE
jgi:predicted O-methyltransferase YrrM